MKYTSIVFNPKLQPHLKHNDRTDLRSKNIYQDKTHLNECTATASEVNQQINKLYSEAMEKQKGVKGKKTPKERSYTECIIEIKRDTTMEQLKELSQEIEKLTGFRALQISIHRDEGHFKNDKFITHYHAHIVFFTLDKETGKQLARNRVSLTPKNLSKMQDIASKILEMQRGEKRHEKKEKKVYFKDYRQYKLYQESLKHIEETREKAIAEIKELQAKIQQQQEELERQKKIIQGKYQESFKELERYYLNQRNTLKNILSFGKHHKRLSEEFYTATEHLTAQTSAIEHHAEAKAKEVYKNLEQRVGELENLIQLKDKALLEKEERIKTISKTFDRYEENVIKNLMTWIPSLDYDKAKSIINKPQTHQKSLEINRARGR